MSKLVNETELLEWTGFKRRGDLDNWLREKRIPFFSGRGGQICTTQIAIDSRLTGIEHPGTTQTIEFA